MSRLCGHTPVVLNGDAPDGDDDDDDSSDGDDDDDAHEADDSDDQEKQQGCFQLNTSESERRGYDSPAAHNKNAM